MPEIDIYYPNDSGLSSDSTSINRALRPPARNGDRPQRGEIQQPADQFSTTSRSSADEEREHRLRRRQHRQPSDSLPRMSSNPSNALQVSRSLVALFIDTGEDVQSTSSDVSMSVMTRAAVSRDLDEEAPESRPSTLYTSQSSITSVPDDFQELTGHRNFVKNIMMICIYMYYWLGSYVLFRLEDEWRFYQSRRAPPCIRSGSRSINDRDGGSTENQGRQHAPNAEKIPHTIRGQRLHSSDGLVSVYFDSEQRYFLKSTKKFVQIRTRRKTDHRALNHLSTIDMKNLFCYKVCRSFLFLSVLCWVVAKILQFVRISTCIPHGATVYETWLYLFCAVAVRVAFEIVLDNILLFLSLANKWEVLRDTVMFKSEIMYEPYDTIEDFHRVGHYLNFQVLLSFP